ncbi:chlorogenic acid esterase precursor [Phlyctema vagabunda]|uniref:Carboxylic ester hydrolase n=1 Tax=Phlyctema vagabunda TaxID=108571 RepID=A0ABR4PUR4_9HELO
MRCSFSSVFVASLIPAALCVGENAQGLVVQTTSGEVHGFINSSAPLVRQFLGVPYAEPPVGALRFLPPQDKADAGAINATEFGPSCMQQFGNSTTIYTARVPQYLINGGQSEDCLYLHIWAPALKEDDPQELALPVFLYIPGGGFTSGGSNSVYKLPDQWIQRTQSHIVIVMNYRVNVFGYPNARGLTDRNPGLLDQRKAVEWARDNVAAFGGDPKRITLWGQSAGGASTSTYGYAYPEDPIVSSLISDSGSANILASQDRAQTNFTFLASLVGCRDLEPLLELDCVRNVSAVTLENALSNYGISGARPSISFSPFPDNVTVFSNTTDRALRGLVAKIPAILGSNTNEGAGFVSFTPNGPGAAALFAATQNIIACPLGREVRNRNLVGLPTYRYQYAGNFSNISPVSWFGAYHSAELPILFGTHDQFRGPSTDYEYEVSHAMEAFWLSFASNPTAGPARWTAKEGYVAWPQYQQNTSSMVLFAEGDTLQQLVTGARIDGSCTS